MRLGSRNPRDTRAAARSWPLRPRTEDRLLLPVPKPHRASADSEGEPGRDATLGSRLRQRDRGLDPAARADRARSRAGPRARRPCRSGTIVLWESLDRLVGDDALEDHGRPRALPRHRAPRRGSPRHDLPPVPRGARPRCHASTDRPIDAWDPFLEAHPATQRLADETLTLGDDRLVISPLRSAAPFQATRRSSTEPPPARTDGTPTKASTSTAADDCWCRAMAAALSEGGALQARADPDRPSQHARRRLADRRQEGHRPPARALSAPTSAHRGADAQEGHRRSTGTAAR